MFFVVNNKKKFLLIIFISGFINFFLVNVNAESLPKEDVFFKEKINKKNKFSLLNVIFDGRRPKEITVKENISGKIVVIKSSEFLGKRFFDDYKVQGAGKTKVIISNGIDTYTLKLETSQKSDEKKITSKQLPGKQKNKIKSWGPAFFIEFWNSIDLKKKIKLGFLIGFFIIILAIFCKMLFKIIFRGPKTDELNLVADSSDDFEPDEEELKRITERLKIMEAHEKFKNRIVDILLNRGLIDTKQLEEALALEKSSAKKAEIILVESGKVSASDVFSARAERYGMEFIEKNKILDQENYFIDKNALSSMSHKFASEQGVFPYRINRNRKILYCMYSFKPTESLGDDIRRETGFYSKFAIVESDFIESLVKKYKNYFISNEAFNIEDMMDKKQKKALNIKKQTREFKFIMSGIVVKLILSIVVIFFGIYLYVINSDGSKLRNRFKECMVAIQKKNAKDVFKYVDPQTARVFDIYSLKKKCGITSTSFLHNYSIFDLDFNDDATRATIKWVGVFDKNGSKGRTEFTHVWGKVSNKWVFMPLELAE